MVIGTVEVGARALLASSLPPAHALRFFALRCAAHARPACFALSAYGERQFGRDLGLGGSAAPPQGAPLLHVITARKASAATTQINTRSTKHKTKPNQNQR